MNKVEKAARYLASQGAGKVAEHQAIVEQAERLLHDPTFTPAPLPRFESYDWEKTELFEADAPRAIFIGKMTDATTGQGMTRHFHAGWARSVSEARRSMARAIGPHLAHGAVISTALLSPDADLFVGPALRDMLHRAATGKDSPAVLRYEASLHINLS
jgi:hypothetical protein